MKKSIHIDHTGVVRDADGAELGRVTFATECCPERRRLQIAALRAMLKTDSDEFSMGIHRAALEQLLAENRGEM